MKREPKPPTKVPFDEHGNLVDDSYSHAVEEWRENYTFTDTLVYEDWARGRSAVTIYWRSTTTGVRYCMFMKDLDEILRANVLNGNQVTANWTFVKRSSYYGVKLA